jgi:tetratricopeptide (TPR) repeat protein
MSLFKHAAATFALWVAFGLTMAHAEPATPAPAGPAPLAEPEAPKPPRPSTLDELFEKLKNARDEGEGKAAAASIERRWLRSGSDTADLLLGRALEATSAEDYPLAIELLDRVIYLQPQWAEAWNKRATVFYMMGDRLRSMADIEEVLVREPRHFGALSGMGMIFSGIGNKKRAYDAFKQALAINPWLDQLKAMVEQLEPQVRGRDI